MSKLLILVLIIYSSNLSVRECKIDLKKLTGDWLPLVSFPNIVFLPICERRELTIKDETCECGNKTVPLIQMKNLKDGTIDGEFPTIIVEKSEDVAPALKMKCKCGGEENFHVVIRYINENYFVEYEIQSFPYIAYTHQEPNTATLLVKKVTTQKDIEDVIQASDDLRNRSSGVVCPSAFDRN